MARVQYFGKTTASTSVTVYWAGTTTKPTIYGSATGSSISNPLTSSFEGDYSFWVDEGHYKILNGKLVNGVATNIDDAYILSTQGAEPTASKSSLAPFQTNTATNVEAWVEGAHTGSTYVAASALKSATTVVGVAAATAPSSGQVLTATSSTTATWQTPSAGVTGANPTASVGLTAVNGAAATFMRSDGAPALDQSIAPTWTAAHTFQQAVADTSTDGLVLATSTAATSGNQKYSPRVRFRGSYFSGSAKSTDWTIDNQPTASGGLLVFKHSDNGAAYATAFTVSAGGTMLLGGATDPGFSAGSLGSAATIYSGDIRCRGVGGNHVYMAADVFNLKSTNRIAFTDGDAGGGTADTFMYRAAAADLRHGAAAANPPVAQTISVQDASGTDIAGATWTFRGSRGTGTGTPGSIAFQTSTALGTGTTLQTATTRLTISSTAVTSTLPVIVPGYTVANLPTGVTGMRAYVTDANATTFLSTVAGGGANTVPVFYNGTNWVIG